MSRSGGVLNDANSTSTVLSVGETFTGGGAPVKDFASVSVAIASNTSGTLKMEQSTDNVNFDFIKTVTFTGGTLEEGLQITAPFYRTCFTTGGTQKHFRLSTMFHYAAQSNDAIISTLDKHTVLDDASNENEKDLVELQMLALAELKLLNARAELAWETGITAEDIEDE